MNNELIVGAVERFYKAVSDLLGAEHRFQPFPYGKRTRWNNRLPGNGRYPGHGLVRRYGPDTIHIQLHSPPLAGVYTSEQAALRAIQTALQATMPGA
jgi:hypothetical protein